MIPVVNTSESIIMYDELIETRCEEAVSPTLGIPNANLELFSELLRIINYEYSLNYLNKISSKYTPLFNNINFLFNAVPNVLNFIAFNRRVFPAAYSSEYYGYLDEQSLPDRIFRIILQHGSISPFKETHERIYNRAHTDEVKEIERDFNRV